MIEMQTLQLVLENILEILCVCACRYMYGILYITSRATIAT